MELWSILATVSATVSNTGSVAGATVLQLYLSYPEEANAPVRSLRGFEKVALDAGTSATLHFPLSRRDLSYWDTITQAWTLPASTVTVHVGFSSRNLPLRSEFAVPVIPASSLNVVETTRAF